MTGNISKAQREGGKYAVQATLVTELTILSLLFTFLLSATHSASFLIAFFDWISPSTFILFVLSTTVLSYALGRKAGVAILVKGKGGYRMCYFIAMAVVLLSTLLVSFFTLGSQYLSSGLPGDWLFYYLAKPIIWMTFLSALPVLVAGVWYKNHLEKLTLKF